MPEDKIEAISSKSTKKSTEDRWQKYLDRLEAELADQKGDIFDSPTVQKMLTMSHHVQIGETKRTLQQLRDFIKRVQIKDLTNAHEPGIQQIMPVAIQVIGAIAVGILGIAPIVGGLSTATIGLTSKAADLVNGVAVNGSQAVGNIFNGHKQAEIAEHNHSLQASNNLHEDINSSSREGVDARRRQKELIDQMEQARHRGIEAAS